jgi:pimeloyl-ACP methyl ester carboxylesterase
MEQQMKPTVVLMHGAFAESSSWNAVAARLAGGGHRVIAFAVPLRSIASDAAALDDLLRTVEGPVVLVGHSYGGAVITNSTAADVVALVYVAGFALAPGESCADASALAPGSTLGETLELVPLAAGGADAYIAQDRYHQQFAADLPADEAAVMAVTQRPVTQLALSGPSGDGPRWRSVPSWFLFGELDRNIPAGAHRIMAERAGARRSVEVAGASHVVGISHPAEVAAIIDEAAESTSYAGA